MFCKPPCVGKLHVIFLPVKNPQIWFWMFWWWFFNVAYFLPDVFLLIQSKSFHQIRSHHQSFIMNSSHPTSNGLLRFHQDFFPPQSLTASLPLKSSRKNLMGSRIVFLEPTMKIRGELLNFGGVKQIHECPWRKLEPWLIRFALFIPKSLNSWVETFVFAKSSCGFLYVEITCMLGNAACIFSEATLCCCGL